MPGKLTVPPTPPQIYTVSAESSKDEPLQQDESKALFHSRDTLICAEAAAPIQTPNKGNYFRYELTQIFNNKINVHNKSDALSTRFKAYFDKLNTYEKYTVCALMLEFSSGRGDDLPWLSKLVRFEEVENSSEIEDLAKISDLMDTFLNAAQTKAEIPFIAKAAVLDPSNRQNHIDTLRGNSKSLQIHIADLRSIESEFSENTPEETEMLHRGELYTSSKGFSTQSDSTANKDKASKESNAGATTVVNTMDDFRPLHDPIGADPIGAGLGTGLAAGTVYSLQLLLLAKTRKSNELLYMALQKNYLLYLCNAITESDPDFFTRFPSLEKELSDIFGKRRSITVKKIFTVNIHNTGIKSTITNPLLTRSQKCFIEILKKAKPFFKSSSKGEVLDDPKRNVSTNLGKEDLGEKIRAKNRLEKITIGTNLAPIQKFTTFAQKSLQEMKSSASGEFNPIDLKIQLQLLERSLDDTIDTNSTMFTKDEKLNIRNDIMKNILSNIKHETSGYNAQRGDLLHYYFIYLGKKDGFDLSTYFQDTKFDAGLLAELSKYDMHNENAYQKLKNAKNLASFSIEANILFNSMSRKYECDKLMRRITIALYTNENEEFKTIPLGEKTRRLDSLLRSQIDDTLNGRIYAAESVHGSNALNNSIAGLAAYPIHQSAPLAAGLENAPALAGDEFGLGMTVNMIRWPAFMAALGGFTNNEQVFRNTKSLNSCIKLLSALLPKEHPKIEIPENTEEDVVGLTKHPMDTIFNYLTNKDKGQTLQERFNALVTLYSKKLNYGENIDNLTPDQNNHIYQEIYSNMIISYKGPRKFTAYKPLAYIIMEELKENTNRDEFVEVIWRPIFEASKGYYNKATTDLYEAATSGTIMHFESTVLTQLSTQTPPLIYLLNVTASLKADTSNLRSLKKFSLLNAAILSARNDPTATFYFPYKRGYLSRFFMALIGRVLGAAIWAAFISITIPKIGPAIAIALLLMVRMLQSLIRVLGDWFADFPIFRSNRAQIADAITSLNEAKLQVILDKVFNEEYTRHDPDEISNKIKEALKGINAQFDNLDITANRIAKELVRQIKNEPNNPDIIKNTLDRYINVLPSERDKLADKIKVVLSNELKMVLSNQIAIEILREFNANNIFAPQSKDKQKILKDIMHKYLGNVGGFVDFSVEFAKLKREAFSSIDKENEKLRREISYAKNSDESKLKASNNITINQKRKADLLKDFNQLDNLFYQLEIKEDVDLINEKLQAIKLPKKPVPVGKIEITEAVGVNTAAERNKEKLKYLKEILQSYLAGYGSKVSYLDKLRKIKLLIRQLEMDDDQEIDAALKYTLICEVKECMDSSPSNMLFRKDNGFFTPKRIFADIVLQFGIGVPSALSHVDLNVILEYTLAVGFDTGSSLSSWLGGLLEQANANPISDEWQKGTKMRKDDALDFLDEHPELIKKFKDVITEDRAYLHDNPTDTNWLKNKITAEIAEYGFSYRVLFGKSVALFGIHRNKFGIGNPHSLDKFTELLNQQAQIPLNPAEVGGIGYTTTSA